MNRASKICQSQLTDTLLIHFTYVRLSLVNSNYIPKTS